MAEIAKQMDALFGELRSLLHGDARDRGQTLWTILSKAHALDAQWYQAQWRPYLSNHTLPTLTIRSLSMLDQARIILPTDATCTLILNDLKLGDEPTAERLACADLPQIQHLHLRNNQLTVRGVNAISRLKCAKHLIGLDLGGNAIGQDGVKSIVCNKRFKKLKHLSLQNIQVTDILAPFARSKLKLTHLDIGRNRLHKDYKNRYWHTEPLAHDQCFRSLKSLSLRETNLCNDSLDLITHTPNLANLEQLDLSHNRWITQRGIQTMVDQRPALSRLTTLDLSACALGPDGILLLINHVALPKLNRLILRQTHITIPVDLALQSLTKRRGVDVIVDDRR